MSNDTREELRKIRVYESDKERINALRQGSDKQADVVRDLLEHPSPPEDDVETIADALADDEVAIIGGKSTISEEIAERLEDATEEDLPDDIREQLDRIERAATTAEERTGELQSTLEGLQR